MAPSNPKRPPRPPQPPGTQAPSEESELELPFDDDEVMPLRADDPRPQRVPQFPAGARRKPRRSAQSGRDRELAARFDAQEYSDPGHSPAFLYVERGPGAGQLVPVKQGPLVLGRSSTSDLRLQHPSISRRHAQLVRKGEGFTICDLGSQNGTFVNRKRISAEVELHIGDEIALGNALLKLRGGNASAPVAEPPPPEPKPRVDSPRQPMPRRRTHTGMSMGRVALIAAVAGSAVAALLTLVLLKVMDPGETVTVVEPEQAVATSAASEPDDAQQADPGAPASSNKRASKRVRGASEKEPSAQAVALQAKGPGSRRQEPGIRIVKGTTSAEGDADESDVLARYEAGDVNEALALARKARLEPLASRIAAFTAAETAGQKALAENDTAGALKHLASAFLLDEQLSHGWSTQGRELRKQLGNLHTAQGVQQQREGNQSAARESFETALKYDSANAQAKTHLGELTGSAPPAK